jgi:hypothetical protein
MNPAPAAVPDRKLFRLLVTLVLAVGLFDQCFWNIFTIGCSEALFCLGLPVLILANRSGWSRQFPVKIILGLILGNEIAMLIEPGASTVVVWLALIVALGGETFFSATANRWGRWFAQGIAVVFAPSRVAWLAWAISRAAFQEEVGILRRLLLGGLLLLPALSLALLFGWLLGSGNAVFSLWTQDFFHAFWSFLERFLDPWRFFFWLIVASILLPLLRPAQIPDFWWAWVTRLPRSENIVPPRFLTFSSVLVLVVMNLLFGIANFADLLFLWHGATLPAGVTYAQFVHSGVEVLITTVILSGVILTLIFQQALDVVRHRGLKVLALAWIAQNLFLIFSVTLRLKRYMEAYDMTVTRLSVILFLVLVAAGYALLAIKIMRHRSLSWLLGALALATFGLLYAAQFMNLAGWTANYNVAQWEADRTRNLDVDYLECLGPAAWPALRRADQIAPLDRRVQEAVKIIKTEEEDEKNWRSWTLRAWWNRDPLAAESPRSSK